MNEKAKQILNKLDFNIKDPIKRKELVENLLNTAPINSFSDSTKNNLYEKMSDYIIDASIKKEKSSQKIKKTEVLTKYAIKTIAEKEISIQQLQQENEKVNIDNIITLEELYKDDKIQNTAPKTEDNFNILNIPYIQNINNAIGNLRNLLSNTVMSRKQATLIFKNISELESDRRYIIDYYTKREVNSNKSKCFSPRGQIDYDNDTGYINLLGEYILVSENFLDLMNPEVWNNLIKFYVTVKKSIDDEVSNNIKYIYMIFEDIVDTELKDKLPLYFDILKWKIDGFTIDEITYLINKKYNTKHNNNVINTAITKTIPTYLSKKYCEKWVINRYKQNPKFLNQWKLCKFCGKIKPRSPLFWSKNSNIEGYYSKCKDCRNINSKINVFNRAIPNLNFDEDKETTKIMKQRTKRGANNG